MAAELDSAAAAERQLAATAELAAASVAELDSATAAERQLAPTLRFSIAATAAQAEVAE